MPTQFLVNGRWVDVETMRKMRQVSEKKDEKKEETKVTKKVTKKTKK